jgi:hypothetical protein
VTESNRSVGRKIKSGSLRTALLALRDRLAAEIDIAQDPRDVATLSKELREVLKAVDALPVEGVPSRLDEIAARRAQRQAAGSDGA